MIRKRLNYVTFSLRFVIFCLPFLAFGIAGFIRFHVRVILLAEGKVDPAPYFLLAVFATAVWALTAERLGLTSLDDLFAIGGKTRRLLVAIGITYGILFVAVFFYRTITFSRAFIVLSACILFILAFLARICFRIVLELNRRRGKNYVRALIVGTDRHAAQVGQLLENERLMPCSLVGYVRLPGLPIEVTNCPILNLEDVPSLTNGHSADEVVIAIPFDRFNEIPSIMKHLEPLCVPIRAVLKFEEDIFFRESLFDLSGISMLDLHSTPAESLPYLIPKRILDIAFSLVVLLFTAPLMLILALLVKLSSRGPVFFVQERVGLNGRVFKMYKLRTMEVSSGSESDTRWTIEDDPHRTAVGSFMRRLNLDELPQFYNVLKGDMSIVGPRPERPYFVQKFLCDVSKYNARHYLKVGITGWAQVNGWRGDTSIDSRIEHDLFYLRNWSLTFDLQIIFLTLQRMFSSKNAY
jgi:Undecaprenyl-phosphate glucose phosphotransferase